MVIQPTRNPIENDLPFTVSSVTPVTAPLGRVVRVTLGSVDRDEDGDANLPLTIEMPLDFEGLADIRVPCFGWEGNITDPDECFPFIFEPSGALDFGKITGSEFPQRGELVFPEGPVSVGSRVQLLQGDDCYNYRVRLITNV
jgi:hypothetical protein